MFTAVDEGPDSAAVLGAQVPGRVGDYRVLRELGRGGMAVVYEAEQKSLGRRVALKVLTGTALTIQQVRRFEREARSAARLHHTNIVPVFGVGHEGNVHYYVMQYIPGQPLDQVLKEVRRLRRGNHGSGQESAAASVVRADERPSASQVALSLWSGRGILPVIDDGPEGPSTTECPAADPTLPDQTERNSAPTPDPPVDPVGPAIPSCSHSDVLSSSVDLTGSGRRYAIAIARIGAQVADALEYAADQGIIHRDVKPSNILLDLCETAWVTDFGLAKVSGLEDLTHSGDLVGTLRYMAPERFRGEADRRSDVYALGLTLYELLVLRPAHNESDRARLIRQVTEEEAPRLSKLDPTIPRDLATIVHKAMAREPAERYTTAGAMASDLRRFLDDRPVVARRPSLVDRAAKWARRHRYAVWSGTISLAALLVLSVIGLAVSNVLISREKDRKDAALREKGQALREREAALAAVGASEREARTNLRLARKAVDGLYTQLAEDLYALPRMQSLQRKFLLQALEFYEEFSAQKGSDPEIRFETGRAYRRVGSIQHLLGQRPQASQALRRAIALLERLAEDFPEEAKYRTELASAYSTLGFTLVDTGEIRPGSDAYRYATELMEHLASDSSAAPDSRERLSDAYRRLGTLPGIPTPEAERALRCAVRLCEDLLAEFPDEARYRTDLLMSAENLGYVLSASGRHEEAEKSFREITATCEAAGTLLASSHRRELLAALNRDLAGVLLRAGRTEDAVGHRANLTSTLMVLADAQQRAGRPLKAIETFEKAMASYDTVTEASPGDLQRPLGKAAMLNDLGRLLTDTHRPAEARVAYQKASDLCEKLAAQIPNNPAIGREFQADLYFQWARALAPLGRPRETLETARKAVELYTGLAAQRSDGPAPQEVMYRSRLAISSHLLGVALAATGSFREAADAYRRAVALHPERALFNNDLAWFLVASKDPPPHDPTEAVALARKAVGIEPTASHIWNTLGVAHYRARECRAAIVALENSEELGHGREFGFNAFFLSLSRWQLGERDEARHLYDRAVEWMEKNRSKDQELRRFRAEATNMLHVEDRAPTETEKPPR
jgi:serine/threonine protein kinase